MARAFTAHSWHQQPIAYVDLNWPRVSAKHRKDIAEALTTATMALLSTRRGAPPAEEIRNAPYRWSFNKGRRATDRPEELATALHWLESNTADLSSLSDPALTRKLLDALALRLDGKAAAASTVHRKRAIVGGALRYAVETGHLSAHPFERATWKAPKLSTEVDRRAVVNQGQGHRLLIGFRQTTPELEALFGTMYWAALRPEESLNLLDSEYERPREKGGWGRLHLTGALSEAVPGGPTPGTRSRNEGSSTGPTTRYARCQQPHRCAHCLITTSSSGRPGPQRPALCYPARAGRDLRRCEEPPGYPQCDRHGVPQCPGCRVTPIEQASPLTRRPYDLRAACVSYWLSRGISPALVARWAGHSIKVLLEIYASWIFGEEAAAMKRIEEGFTLFPTTPGTSAPPDQAPDFRGTHGGQIARSSGTE